MILEQIYEVKAEQNNTMQICLVWSFEMNPLWTTFSFDFSPFFFFFFFFSLPPVLDYKGFTALKQLLQAS